MMFNFSELLLIPISIELLGRTLKLKTAFDSDAHESTQQWFYAISKSASRGDAFFASWGFILQFATVFR